MVKVIDTSNISPSFLGFMSMCVSVYVRERQTKREMDAEHESDCFIFWGAGHHIINTRALCCDVGCILTLLRDPFLIC